MQQPVAAAGKSLKQSGYSLSGKKDRLGAGTDIALHPFVTGSALTFMLKPGAPLLGSLQTAFGEGPCFRPHRPDLARGIVAGLKARMLFPVHYFW